MFVDVDRPGLLSAEKDYWRCVDWRFDNLSGSHLRDKIVETSVNINNNNNSPSQVYTNLDDLHLQTCIDTPGLEIDNICENI